MHVMNATMAIENDSSEVPPLGYNAAVNRGLNAPIRVISTRNAKGWELNTNKLR